MCSESSVGPHDPTFVGCWWLGYVICAVGVIALAIPMSFFPKSYTNSPPDGVSRKLSSESAIHEQHKETTNKRLVDQIKG